jgi:hypothetical protein
LGTTKKKSGLQEGFPKQVSDNLIFKNFSFVAKLYSKFTMVFIC